jgi:hypothetical protein
MCVLDRILLAGLRFVRVSSQALRKMYLHRSKQFGLIGGPSSRIGHAIRRPVFSLWRVEDSPEADAIEHILRKARIPFRRFLVQDSFDSRNPEVCVGARTLFSIEEVEEAIRTHRAGYSLPKRRTHTVVELGTLERWHRIGPTIVGALKERLETNAARGDGRETKS